jgi:serine/threonine-protein kinase
MALLSGSRVGRYEIGDQIGLGGMGEVYLALDSALKRKVALKILPESVATDPERLLRFEREAQVLASLNHPHIAQVHGLEQSGGRQALIMELVEGPTLADRLVQGALPVDEALAIAGQIAEALEAAHERGIIHRDLKPSNIKAPPDANVKVLDFGLAKILDPVSESPAGASESPTITTPAMTRLGVILGTAAYMSPEQAKGRQADRRSDVWAFGAVLYEMLTGSRAFGGEDMSETLAAVLKSDPDWSLLPTDTPFAVRALLKGCLAKDPRQRVAHLSTAKFALSELSDSGAPASRAGASIGVPDRNRRQWILPAALAAALAAAVVAGGAWVLRPSSDPPLVAHFSIAPDARAFSGTLVQVVALSPNGTLLAYTAGGRLYLRPIRVLESHSIPGTEAYFPLNPIFSPDGQSIAFFTVSGGNAALQRVHLSGGAASTLATFEAGTSWFSGVSWSDEAILIGALGRGILRVPPNGGRVEQVIEVSPDELAHGPQLLPDGRTVLFTVTTSAGDDRWDTARVVAQSLVDGTRRVLVQGSDGRYARSGHLIYSVGGTLFAVNFDPGNLTTSGPAVPVVAGVRRATGGYSGVVQFALSDTGTLAYVPGPATGISTRRTLVLGDGRTDPAPLDLPPAAYVHPRVSPNGRHLAVGQTEGTASDIWTYDLSGRSEIKRVTFGGHDRFPVWTADSRRITFQSAREGDRAIWWQTASGGTPERLTTPAPGEEHVPEAWSRDGTRLLFSVFKDSMFSLWVFTLESKKVEPFGRVQSGEPLSATFSPDGRWVAYALTDRASSGISSNRGVYVEPFPPTGERHQVPKQLVDFHPRWAPDGRSIFFVPGSGQPAVSVPVATEPSVTFGTIVDLQRGPIPGLLGRDMRGYDLLPDGRFISIGPVGTEPGAGRPEVRIILNWAAGLGPAVPAK